MISQGERCGLNIVSDILTSADHLHDVKTHDVRFYRGQANKSVGRMTWHQEPKKDVTSCEKLRLGANIHRPADVRMGKPDGIENRHHILNT